MSFAARVGVSLAVLAVALLAATDNTQGRPFKTGFVDDQSFYGVPPGVGNLWLGRARDAGAELVRINAYWSTIAPPKRTRDFTPANPADPAYSWWRLDETVRNVAANGLTPIMTVLSAPSWAEGEHRPLGVRDGTWRPDPAELAAFAKALALRYGGSFPDPHDERATLPRIAYFQGWNEPNLNAYLTPQYKRGRPVSPKIYRALQNSFYEAVKSIQRSAFVISAGLAPLARPRASVAPLRFMRILTCMRGGRHPRPTCPQSLNADIWATHPYTTGGPQHEAAKRDDVSLGDLPEMATLLRAAGSYRHIRGRSRRIPFWVTEFSWDTSPPDPGGVPMRIAKRWVPEALYQMWSAGVSAMTWLTIRDGPDPNGDLSWGDTYQSGFYTYRRNPRANTFKPSLSSFKFPFVAYPKKRDIYVWGRTPTSESGAVPIQIRHPRGWRNIGFARANRAGIFNATIHVENPRGALRAWFGSKVSVPFSLKPSRDRYYPPFGGRRASDPADRIHRSSLR